MGQIYKADFQVDNGTDYDKYNFSTTADQVSYSKNGGITDVQAELDEVNTGLAYKDIADQISLGDSGLSIYDAFTENGVCYIRVALLRNIVGVRKLTINKAYAPRATVNGTYASTGSASDFDKVKGSYINNNGEIRIWIAEALTQVETITFIYPLIRM